MPSTRLSTRGQVQVDAGCADLHQDLLDRFMATCKERVAEGNGLRNLSSLIPLDLVEAHLQGDGQEGAVAEGEVTL